MKLRNTTERTVVLPPGEEVEIRRFGTWVSPDENPPLRVLSIDRLDADYEPPTVETEAETFLPGYGYAGAGDVAASDGGAASVEDDIPESTLDMVSRADLPSNAETETDGGIDPPEEGEISGFLFVGDTVTACPYCDEPRIQERKVKRPRYYCPYCKREFSTPNRRPSKT